MNRKEWATIRVTRKYDRRVKLSDQQKQDIKAEYENGKTSQRKLAFKYGVSRRSIQFIIAPEKLADNLARRAERGGWKQYYTTEDRRQEMRSHRSYIKTLRYKKLI